jgi:hypothetical protein
MSQQEVCEDEHAFATWKGGAASAACLRPVGCFRCGFSLDHLIQRLAVPFDPGGAPRDYQPLKVLAVLVAGDGHFIAGTLVMICAYSGSFFCHGAALQSSKAETLDPAVVCYDVELVCYGS